MHLNSHTYYSLRYGTLSVEELCALGRAGGETAMALTDINNTSACMNFVKIAPQYGIKPLVGIDFRNGTQQQYVGIAKNNEGFRRLNEHLSVHLHSGKEFAPEAPELEDCIIIYPLERVTALQKKNFSENEYIGISSESLRKLKFSPYRDNNNNSNIDHSKPSNHSKSSNNYNLSNQNNRSRSGPSNDSNHSNPKVNSGQDYRDKLVLLQAVSFRDKKDFNAHRLLRCIGLNTLLSKLPENEQGKPTDMLLPVEQLEQEFEEFPHILENTRQLISQCDVQFSFGEKHNNQNLKVFGSSPEEDAEVLCKLTYENLPKRFPKANETVLARVEKELDAIIELGFTSYFLINHNIIEYARSKNYPYIGRGSGANSVVAYIIGITNVDPIELDLYFERFINAHRNSPPDFDLDFSWKDREDITSYIFRTYEHTALLTTYVTFKRRAVARELGKVFGLPKENIDKLSTGHYNLEELDEIEWLVLRYSHLIEGFPNYLGVHSGGIIILDRPVHCFAATFMPPKGFATVQIDMNISEEVGIFKFDILAQRGLPKITDAIKLVRQNQPEAYLEDINNANVFKHDPEINALLSRGDCMGVFYVESPAMRGLLTKLQTDNYLGLVAASSIIRPGVSSGGMKDEYILRHRQPERRRQAHPVLYEILKETYGVMVYQEDVLKVAHYFAGLSLDEADVLRRGMSGKKTSKGQIEKIEQQFRDNCRKKGYAQMLIDEVWQQIQSFAGYAFPKGHSASYAVESYQSLYLKRYFPLEFMVAVLNNGGGFYDVETYIQEIRRWGGRVHPPCINHSDHPTVIKGTDIYLGLGYVKELEGKTIKQLLESRAFFGEYQSLDNFIDRVEISLEQLALLLKVGAFRFTGQDKHELLWKAHFKLNARGSRSLQAALFRPAHRDFKLPHLEHSWLIDAYDEMELLGFTLYNHFELCGISDFPFLVSRRARNGHNELPQRLQRETRSREVTNFAEHCGRRATEVNSGRVTDNQLLAAALPSWVGREVVLYGDLVSSRTLRTSTGKLMAFGTFFDQEGNIFDTVSFPGTAERYPLYSKGVYLCCGTVIEEFGYYSISIKWLKRQETMRDPRRV